MTRTGLEPFPDRMGVRNERRAPRRPPPEGAPSFPSRIERSAIRSRT